MKFRNFFIDAKNIESTISRLIEDDCITPHKGEILKKNLHDTIHQSRYILLNLGAHMSMGAIFAFDIIPLPMGTISRILWVIGNRIFFEIWRNRGKCKVHSLPVLLISAIPWIGYFAYTYPLKKINEDAAYLYANHITCWS